MIPVTDLTPLSEEERRQHKLLLTPLGIPGSGVTRYAAAMWFFKARKIDSETLEVYRICSKLDSEDPVEVMASRR